MSNSGQQRVLPHIRSLYDELKLQWYRLSKALLSLA